MKFVKALMSTFLANILVIAIGMVVSIMTSRWLGASARGTYAVSASVVSFFLIMLDLGIGVANTYFVGKNRENVNAILGCNVVILIMEFAAIGILYLIGTFTHLIIFEFLFKGLTGDILVVTLLTIPVTSLKTALTNVVLGLEEYKHYNIFNIVYQVINFILVLVFLLLFHSVFYVLLANALTLTVIVVLLARLIFKRKFHLSFSGSVFKAMVRYGVKAQISNLVQFVTYNLDVFIINFYSTASNVGLYNTAVVLSNMLWQIPGTISILMYPAMSNLDDKDYIRRITNKTTRISMLVILLCCTILALVSRPLVLLLYTKSFQGAVAPLLLLLPGIAFFSISKILAATIAGMGRVDINLKISMIISALTILLDFTIIPRFGIIGASAVSSVTYILHAALTLWYFKKLTGSRMRDVLVIKKEDILNIRAHIQTKLKKAA